VQLAQRFQNRETLNFVPSVVCEMRAIILKAALSFLWKKCCSVIWNMCCDDCAIEK